MSLEQLVNWILTITPFLAVVIALWVGSRENARLKSVDQLGSVIERLDPSHDRALRTALIETQEDLIVSFLRRHRWRYGLAGQTISTAAWIALAGVSAVIWQATGWSQDAEVFMVVALVGYGLGFAGMVRRWWIRAMYKDEGKLYMGTNKSK